MGKSLAFPFQLAQDVEQTAIFWCHLIFKLFDSSFEMLSLSYTHNPFSREPLILFSFIFGTPSIIFPERYTSSKLSQRTQAGARAKSKGRGWAVV